MQQLTKAQTVQLINESSEVITYVCSEMSEVDTTTIQDKIDIIEICVSVLDGTYTYDGEGGAKYNNDARGVMMSDFDTLDTMVRDDICDYFADDNEIMFS
tara:strand:+ start:614 stop:913 length:300 start_codon:yes stop_codon:yes gene_type:complete